MPKSIIKEINGTEVYIEPVYQDGKINFVFAIPNEENMEKRLKFTNNAYYYVNQEKNIIDEDLDKEYKDIIKQLPKIINEEKLNYQTINFADNFAFIIRSYDKKLTQKELQKLERLLKDFSPKMKEKDKQKLINKIKKEFPNIDIEFRYQDPGYGVITEKKIVEAENLSLNKIPLNKFINSKKMKKIYEDYRKDIKNIKNKKMSRETKSFFLKNQLNKWAEQFNRHFTIDENLIKNMNLTGVNKEELKTLYYTLTNTIPEENLDFKQLKNLKYFQYLIINRITKELGTKNIEIDPKFLEKELQELVSELDNTNVKTKTNEIIKENYQIKKLFILNDLITMTYNKYQKKEIKDNLLNVYYQNLDSDTSEIEKMFEIAKKYKFNFASIPHLFYTDDKTMKKFLKEIEPLEKTVMKKLKDPNKTNNLLAPYKNKEEYNKNKNELLKPMDKNLQNFFKSNIENIFKAFNIEIEKKLNLSEFNTKITEFLYILKEFAPEKIFELKQKFEKMLKEKEQLKQQKGEIASRELLLSIRNIQTILTHINQIIEKFGLNNKQNLKTEENIELNNF